MLQCTDSTACGVRHSAFLAANCGEAITSTTGIQISVLVNGSKNADLSSKATASMTLVDGVFVYQYSTAAFPTGTTFTEVITAPIPNSTTRRAIGITNHIKPGLCREDLEKIAAYVHMQSLCDSETCWHSIAGKQKSLHSLGALAMAALGKQHLMNRSADGSQIERMVNAACANGSPYGSLIMKTDCNKVVSMTPSCGVPQPQARPHVHGCRCEACHAMSPPHFY